MRIGTRIGIGFSAIVVLTGVLGAAGWFGLQRYALSVDDADRMATIADTARSAGSDIDAYRASQDPDRISAATGKLAAARNIASGAGLDTVVGSIERVETAFDDLVNLMDTTAEARQGLFDRIAEMESVAEAMRAHEEQHFASLTTKRDDAMAELLRRIGASTLAEDLGKATLDAQFATYRIRGGDADAVQNTRKAFATLKSNF